MEQQVAGTLPQEHVYELGMPSSELQSVGTSNLPIKMSSKIIEEKSNLDRHPYDILELKGMVKAIQRPLAIFSYGDSGKAHNLVLNITHEGKSFIVGMFIRPTIKGNQLEINSIRNVFPKDNHEWINWINQGKLLRVDGKEEIQTLIGKLRMNPVAFDYVDLDNGAKDSKRI